MLVHVAFTPGEQAPASVGIVVDVLRATSTISQTLASGNERLLCCAEIDEAIEGFDYGNSPREIAAEQKAPTLILSTTNGTRLLVDAASRFEHVYVGSLLNLDAVANAACAHGKDVAVLCARVLRRPHRARPRRRRDRLGQSSGAARRDVRERARRAEREP